MLKKLYFSSLLLCGIIATAQLVNKPDANTLWRITKSTDADWNAGGRIYVKESPKGFTIGDNNPSNKVSHSKFWKVPVDKAYPWFCCDIRAIRPFNGYRCWTIGLQEAAARLGSATNGEPGLIAFNWAENNPKPQASQMKLWAYFYDFEADFNSISLVKVPQNYVYAESPAFAAKKSYGPGDVLTFKVILQEPAEEVLLKLTSWESYWAVKLNGSSTVNLKPLDEEGKIWGATVTVKELTVQRGANLNRGMVLLRATVLGGSVDVPLWGMINFDYKS